VERYHYLRGWEVESTSGVTAVNVYKNVGGGFLVETREGQAADLISMNGAGDGAIAVVEANLAHVWADQGDGYGGVRPELMAQVISEVTGYLGALVGEGRGGL